MSKLQIGLLPFVFALAACSVQEAPVGDADSPVTVTATTAAGETFDVSFWRESQGEGTNGWRAVALGKTYHVETAVDDDGGTIEVRDAAERWLSLSWTEDGHSTITRSDGATAYSSCGQPVPSEAMVAEQPVMVALLDPALLDQVLSADDEVGEAQQALIKGGGLGNNCPGASCGGGAYTCCCNVGERCVVGIGPNAICWCEPAMKP